MIYEFPFNERIRSLMRMEVLGRKFDYFKSQSDPFGHEAAISTLFELAEMTQRIDIKSEVVKALDKQKRLYRVPGTNPFPFDSPAEAADVIDKTRSILLGLFGKPGQTVRDNEWLLGIKSRLVLPSGLCEFDIPSYHYWQHRSPLERTVDLMTWYETFEPVIRSVDVLMAMIRATGETEDVVAEGGNFRKLLSGRTVNLMRLEIDDNLPYVPEASANKYGLMLRFVEAGTSARPAAVTDNVACRITLC